MTLGRQCALLLRCSRQPYLSGVTRSCVGHYATVSHRGFSSSEKLVDVALDEETGKKLFELIGTCFFEYNTEIQ